MRLAVTSGRAMIALAISLSVPLTSASAATRASAAVPSASVADVVTAVPHRGGRVGHWPLFALAAVAVGVLILVVASKKSEEDKPISRG